MFNYRDTLCHKSPNGICNEPEIKALVFEPKEFVDIEGAKVDLILHVFA